MSAFGQKVAAPVRTYEEEMKFLYNAAGVLLEPAN